MTKTIEVWERVIHPKGFSFPSEQEHKMGDIEIEVEITTFTDQAILVESLIGSDVWIPKSQISDYCGDDIDEAETIFIPQWLAVKSDLI